ncbi:hypothetical protein HPP92_024016 [Vanilla planifolia]|uniref:Uncharacterized protein n=1 Tax=Vanilla planifolia TaxID=51239 RepID=A0A835PRZ6_VANPL|nr:hypothetical protein HPP92_024016 [Vanilla planifolia]
MMVTDCSEADCQWCGVTAGGWGAAPDRRDQNTDKFGLRGRREKEEDGDVAQ